MTGGFGSYIIAMDEGTYKLIGVDYPGNKAEDVKNPALGWMIGFMFVVSFLGLFSLVPLRKVFICSYTISLCHSHNDGKIRSCVFLFIHKLSLCS